MSVSAPSGEPLAETAITVVVGNGGASDVPEPATALLLGFGLIGLAGPRRRRGI